MVERKVPLHSALQIFRSLLHRIKPLYELLSVVQPTEANTERILRRIKRAVYDPPLAIGRPLKG
jgi:hypothetical protein